MNAMMLIILVKTCSLCTTVQSEAISFMMKRDFQNIECIGQNQPIFSNIKVLYMMSWAVTDSVGTQLWIDRTCRVNLNYSGWGKVAFECFSQTKCFKKKISQKNMRYQFRFNLSTLKPIIYLFRIQKKNRRNIFHKYFESSSRAHDEK